MCTTQSARPIQVQDRWVDSRYGRFFTRTWTPALKHAPDLPIVLFHDSLGCVELWRDFPEKLCLATAKTVVAYDRLGFGQSDPHPGGWTSQFIQDEAERYFPIVREGLGIGTFIAFGHSVGGAMAAHCASRFTSACQALITESAQAFVEDITLAGIQAAEQAFAAPDAMARLSKYHGTRSRWVLQAWTKTWQADEMRNWALDVSINTLACPTLVMHGTLDEYGSKQHALRIAALSSGRSQLLLIDDCGHVPHRERQALVLDTVAEFLRAAVMCPRTTTA